MALASHPVWPFEPNWESSVGETLAWLTDVMMSPTGAEQRRSLRYLPRRSLNFSVAVEGAERTLFDNLLMAHAARDWYLPIWHDVTITTDESGFTVIPCNPSSAIKVGTPIYIKGSTVYDYQITEVVEVLDDGIRVSPALTSTLAASTIIHPMTVARLVEQPALSAVSDSVEVAEAQFLVVDPPVDPGVQIRTAGPMIVNGLIVNAYHQETGRGGYFHHNSGTSEGQFIFIYALFLAYEQLIDNEPETAIYYKNLALQMLDAIGTGNSYVGPMLRQPIPENADTITLMHWLFAARDDIPGQDVVLAYEVPRVGNTLTIPASANGAQVFKVWQIYPSTSELLYSSPFSPAFDITSPAGETQILLDDGDWSIVGDEARIVIPSGAPVHARWKVVYGYRTNEVVSQGSAFEAYPNWTKIASAYSACAPDTFRWFEQAMQKAIEHDTRAGKADNWRALQLAMRRTAVKGQNITDLREVFEPMIGFDAIPISGAPDGMFCFTTKSDAKGPPSGGNPAWKGYDFWTRGGAGRIVGQIPESNILFTLTLRFPDILSSGATVTINGTNFVVESYGGFFDALIGAFVGGRNITTALEQFAALVNANPNLDATAQNNRVVITSANQMTFSVSNPAIVTESYRGQLPTTQIGRGFSDTWRVSTAYQQADTHLYLKVGFNRALEAGEHFRVFVSATQAYDPASRWFADITVAPGPSVSDLFIPRSAFRLATNTATGSDTTWGSTLPAGQELQNFGIEVANRSAITVRLEAMRLVSNNTLAAVKGSPMPFFPGALPFAINGDMRRQRFVGWNGSPFHGYQLPDHWWWLNDDAVAVHSGKNQNDLPIPAPDGSLTYPITALTAGGDAKPIRAMLMEQQLLFLSQAQAKYAADGGPSGFFAHTFVLNTPARASLGNPTPHTWVYVNDDPNTRWVGYQTRVVESLAELAWLTRADGRFSDARNLAVSLALNWLTRLNVIWPDLQGQMVSGTRIYGMPTDYPDPAVSAPQTLYEEPHAAAHILRACVILKKANAGSTALLDALILRCWQYLEMQYVTTGEMRYTWSPAPAAKQWYGFWHGDIIATLAVMLDNPDEMPSGVSLSTVTQRLVETKEWIEEWGVGRLAPNPEAGLLDEYRGFHVLTLESDWTDAVDRSQQRIYETFEVDVGRPLRADTANRPFPTQRHKWVLDGVAEHATFYALMQALRGRAVPVWVPTWMDDMRINAPSSAGSDTIIVDRCGYTLAGGPRPEREDIMLELLDGRRIYRRVTEAAADSNGRETLLLDASLPTAVSPSNVLRICFMSLMRLDQDSIDIEHLTDLEGVSEVQVTFRAAPNLRVAESAY